MSTTPEPISRITVEERLFSLVLALIATEIGLTKADILSTVQGYRQRYLHGGDNASLERQFERDKDDIRELGIPLETVDQQGDPGNNHLVRYRIPKGLYDLPADVTFSPDELTLLKLAATVWREGSLSAESRRALTKLSALGEAGGDAVLGYAPTLRVREPSFEPLSQAMDRGHVVSFLYLKPGDGAPRRRRVAPRAVVQHEGRWHLFATDQDARASRTFLLSRIVGPVLVVPDAVGVSAAGADPRQAAAGPGQEALAELDALWAANVAVVEVQPDSDAAVRLGNRGTDVPGTAPGSVAGAAPGSASDLPGARLSLHYTDRDVLADELAAFGPEVLVLSPPALRAAVHDRLVRVRDAHASEPQPAAAAAGATPPPAGSPA